MIPGSSGKDGGGGGEEGQGNREGEKPVQEDVWELTIAQAICAQSAGTSDELS